MSSAKQKILENERWPHVKRNWIKAIKAIRVIPASGGGRIVGNPSPRHVIDRKWLQTPSQFLPKGYLASDTTETNGTICGRKQSGFSNGSSSDRLTDEQENEIAENIYDWWTSGKGYHQWYNEKFRQQTLNF